MFQSLASQLDVIRAALRENEDRVAATHLTPALHGSSNAKIYKAYNGYAKPIVFVAWFLDNRDWHPSHLFMGLLSTAINWAQYKDETLTHQLEAVWGVHITRAVRAQLFAAMALSIAPELVTSVQVGIPQESSTNDTALCAIIDVVVRQHVPWVQAIGRHSVMMDLSEQGGEIRASDIVARIEELRHILALEQSHPTEACTFHCIEDACMLKLAKLVCASSFDRELYQKALRDACIDTVVSGVVDEVRTMWYFL